MLSDDIDTSHQLPNFLNVLVVGLDDVEEVHRSDSILLVRIDFDHKLVKAMSIPRDTRVQIRGHKIEKLNHSYAYGGLELLRETVINLTGMPIDYYIIINYKSFPRIVDAIGGVKLNVTKKMRYTDNAQNLHIDITPGLQHMNGEQALKFVRFRHDALGDVGRMQRQQVFVSAVLDKVLSPAIIPRLRDLTESIIAMVKTDIPIQTALQLAWYVKDINTKNVEFFTMPGSSGYIGTVSYWIPDLQAMAAKINPEIKVKSADIKSAPVDRSKSQHISADVTTAVQTKENAESEAEAQKITEPIAILNGNGVRNICTQFSQIFEKAGLEVVYSGNGRHFDYRFSVVYYPRGKNANTAKALAQLCGIQKSLIKPGNYSYAASLVLGHDYKKILKKLSSLPVKK